MHVYCGNVIGPFVQEIGALKLDGVYYGTMI